MSAVETGNGTEHSSVRIYVQGCTYPNGSAVWQDDPSDLLIDMRDAFDNIVNLAYTVLIISNVRNSSGIKLEVHLDGVTWNTSDRLSASNVDSLRTAIQNKLDTVSGFTYNDVDVVCDRFLDNPTTSWETSFEKKEGWS